MKKNDLIAEIFKMELEMFQAVKTDQPSPCQTDPERFKIMRIAQFKCWSMETLASYLNDLEIASQENQNLMTFKYARMDNLIPASNKNELIKRIVDIQASWQKEMAKNYPQLINRGRPIDEDEKTVVTSFRTYLSCELETYSDLTLACLFRDIQLAQQQNENMTEMIYEQMMKGLGYQSIQEAEKEAGNQT